MHWVSLDASAVVDLTTWELTKYRDKAKDVVVVYKKWKQDSLLLLPRWKHSYTLSVVQSTVMGSIPYFSLQGQEPNKRVIENENLNSHLIWAGVDQSQCSKEYISKIF